MEKDEIGLGKGTDCAGHQCKEIRPSPVEYGLLRNAKHPSDVSLFKIKKILKI